MNIYILGLLFKNYQGWCDSEWMTLEIKEINLTLPIGPKINYMDHCILHQD